MAKSKAKGKKHFYNPVVISGILTVRFNLNIGQTVTYNVNDLFVAPVTENHRLLWLTVTNASEPTTNAEFEVVSPSGNQSLGPSQTVMLFKSADRAPGAAVQLSGTKGYSTGIVKAEWSPPDVVPYT
jgi:hypothetical protein